jgi:HK97 family phage portal protein
MNFYQRLKFLMSSKESQARVIMSMSQVGKPVVTPANYENFARLGYSRNAVVYTAINKITTACMGIKWELYSKSSTGAGAITEVTNHPLLTLWNKPNPMQDTSSFVESLVGFKNIAGNSYIEANTGADDTNFNKPPLELWPARPDRMKVIPGNMGYPIAYEFSNGSNKKIWPVNQVDLKSRIMHWKTFNPTNDWYGLAPLEAAMLQLDQNNAGQKWNLALLQNSSTPSGVLQMKVSDSNPRGELTSEQYGRLKSEFETSYTGARNAGKPMIIEGGLSWQSISLSPKEMDFLKGKEVTATDLFLIFGVPPELVGMGVKTFANYKEARLAFYEETVLPTMDSLKGAINAWLTPQFGDNLYLDYDRDDIEALSVRRAEKYTSLAAVDFLTTNEKRLQVGYEEIEGGDDLPGATSSATEGDTNANVAETDTTSEEDTTTQTDESGTEGDAEDSVDDSGKSWKAINLLNSKEKRTSWIKQNRRRKSLEANFNRDVKADYDDLTKRLTKLADKLKGRDTKLIEFALQKEVDAFSPHLEKTLNRHIRITLEDFGQMIFGEAKSLGLGKETKANLKFDSFIEEYIKQHTGSQIKTINNTNEKTIRRVISEWTQEAITAGDSLPELSKFLEAEFEDLSAGSARRIARTEVAMASNNGSLEAVKSLQVPGIYKEWVTANDDRVRDGDKGGADHAAANGQEVPLDEKFTVPPDASMDSPGDPDSPADQVINCRCVLVYKQKGQ